MVVFCSYSWPFEQLNYAGEDHTVRVSIEDRKRQFTSRRRKPRSAELVTYRSRENPTVRSDWSGSPPSNQSIPSDSVWSEFGQSFHLPRNVLATLTIARPTHTRRTKKPLVHFQETICCLHPAHSALTAHYRYGPWPIPPAKCGA